MRNVAAGSLSTRLGIRGGHPPAAQHHRVLLQERRAGRPDGGRGAHHSAFGWAAPQDMDDIVALTLRINDFLSGLFLGASASRWWTSRWSSAGCGRTRTCASCWPTRSARTTAGCGTARPTRRWTRTASAATSAASRRRIREVARRLGILPEAGVRDMQGAGAGAVPNPPRGRSYGGGREGKAPSLVPS